MKEVACLKNKIGYWLQFAISLYSIICYLTVFLLIMLIYDNFLGNLLPNILLFTLIAFFFMIKILKQKKITFINCILVIFLALPIWNIIKNSSIALPILILVSCIVNYFFHVIGLCSVSEWLVDNPSFFFPLVPDKIVKIPVYMENFFNICENNKKYRYFLYVYTCNTSNRLFCCLSGDIIRFLLPIFSLYTTSFLLEKIDFKLIAYILCFVINLIIYRKLCKSLI